MSQEIDMLRIMIIQEIRLPGRIRIIFNGKILIILGMTVLLVFKIIANISILIINYNY